MRKHHLLMTHPFFSYFRRRLHVVCSLPPSPGSVPEELSPDQHILVIAGLDALANHWSRLTRGPSQGQERLAEFLCQHGGHDCFDRVAAPYLLKHAIDHARKKLAADPSFAGSHELAIRASVAVAPTGTQVIPWNDDDDVKTLLGKPELAAVPQDLFLRWRYGGVLYAAHRCAWVHEFDEGDVTDRSIGLSRNEPRYEPRNDRRILVFTGPFLLATYEKAISSFEAWCDSQGQWP